MTAELTPDLAELHAERIRLARDVAYAERLAGESA